MSTILKALRRLEEEAAERTDGAAPAVSADAELRDRILAEEAAARIGGRRRSDGRGGEEPEAAARRGAGAGPGDRDRGFDGPPGAARTGRAAATSDPLDAVAGWLPSRRAVASLTGLAAFLLFLAVAVWYWTAGTAPQRARIAAVASAPADSLPEAKPVGRDPGAAASLPSADDAAALAARGSGNRNSEGATRRSRDTAPSDVPGSSPTPGGSPAGAAPSAPVPAPAPTPTTAGVAEAAPAPVSAPVRAAGPAAGSDRPSAGRSGTAQSATTARATPGSPARRRSEIAASSPDTEPAVETEASAPPAAEPRKASTSPSDREEEDATGVELRDRPPLPDVSVARTVWHPKPDRRTARIRLESSGETVTLREGDAIGGLVVREITPSAVVFASGDVEIQRRVGHGATR